jgi:hypothetical protein
MDFDVMVNGTRVEITRTANGTRWFVCPRCEKICRYLYLVGPACQACLGLRRGSRHHFRHQQTWKGATRWLPGGRKRRRKIVHFVHFKRRSHSTAGLRVRKLLVSGGRLTQPIDVAARLRPTGLHGP